MSGFIIPKASLNNPGIISVDKQFIKGQKIFHITPDSQYPTDPSKIKPAIMILTGNLDEPLFAYKASNVDKGTLVIKEHENSVIDIVSLKAKGPSKFHNGIIIDRVYKLANGSNHYEYGKETFYGLVTIRDSNCQPPSSFNHNTYCGIFSDGEDKIKKSQFLILSSLKGNMPSLEKIQNEERIYNSEKIPSVNNRISCYGAWIKEANKDKRPYYYCAMAGVEGSSPGANVFSIFSDIVNEGGLSRKVTDLQGDGPKIPAASMYLSGFLYGGWFSKSEGIVYKYGEDNHLKIAGIHWITKDIPGLALNRISDGNIATFSNSFPGNAEKKVGALDACALYGLRIANLVKVENSIIQTSPNRDKPNYLDDNKNSKNLISEIWKIIEGIKTYQFAKNGLQNDIIDNRSLNFYPKEVKEKFKQALVTIEKSDGEKEDTGISYADFVPILWEAVNDLNKRIKKLESKG